MSDIEDIDWDALNKKAADRATAKANVEYFKHYRKVVLAELMSSAEIKHNLSAVNAQDRFARTEDRYKKCLSHLRKAIEQFELIDLEYKLLFERIGVWRSKVALHREATKIR